MKPNRILVIVLPLAVLSGAVAGPTCSRDDWKDWSSLRLKARKMLFFSGSFEMSVSERGERTIIETHTNARFLGATLNRTRTITVLDTATGRTLDFRSFSKKRGRHYVFDEGGYTVEKLAPASGFDAPLEDWNVVSTTRYDRAVNETSAPPPRPVYDFYGMLLRLRDAGLDRPGDRATFVVATSKGPKTYHVRVGEARSARRSFVDERSGDRRRLQLREFRIRIAPEDPKAEAEGFLRTEGETELWFESRTKALLQINGRIPRVGRVEIGLDSVGWAESPSRDVTPAAAGR